MGDDGGDQGLSHNDDELQEALQELKSKNVELKRIVDYIQKENSAYKQKYHVLRKKLLNLNDLLEENAKVFYELFDDAKSALQLGQVPMVNSPISQGKCVAPQSGSAHQLNIELTNIEDSRNGSPKAGPSGMVTSISSGGHVRTVSIRKLYIEPLNMQELEQIETENENEYTIMQTTQEEIDSPQDRLSTIIEENSRTPELCVKLERLPTEVVASYIHTQKSAPLSNNSSLNVDDLIFSGADPNFSSTPVKEVMLGRLGLMPSPKMLNNSNSLHQFVSRRKKATGSKTTSTSEPGASTGLVSPKKEKLSLMKIIDNSLINASPYRKVSSSSKENLLSPKKENFSGTPQKENSFTNSKKRQLSTPGATVKTKKKKSSSEVSPRTRSNSRPVRKARPKNLKEERLNTKKRRN